MNKKLTPLSILILILMFPLVSAQIDIRDIDLEEGVNQIIDQIIKFGTPFFEVVIGDYSTNEFFFSKILLLLLLVIVIKNILDRTPIGEDNKKLSILISTVISIISIRFINENDLFQAIFIQYGVLGIAVTTILPMVIFFYFVHNTKVGTFGRKMFWALYAIILGAIWISKSNEIPYVANWIYGLTFIAALIFLFADKTIHSYLGLGDLKKFEKKSNKEAILRSKDRIHKLTERLDRGIINEYEFRRGINEEEKLIRELSKD